MRRRSYLIVVGAFVWIFLFYSWYKTNISNPLHSRIDNASGITCQLSLAVIGSHDPRTVQSTLQSFSDNGAASMFRQFMVSWPGIDPGTEQRELAERLGFVVVDGGSNAIVKLFEKSHCSNVLFVPSGFRAASTDFTQTISNALSVMRASNAQIVRLEAKASIDSGDDALWQSFSRKDSHEMSHDRSGRCSDTDLNYYCAAASTTRLTMEPAIYERQFFLRELAPRLGAGATDFSEDIQSWWRHHSFITAVGEPIILSVPDQE